MNPDIKYMKRALALAKRGRTSPNPMVGAVVVRDGRIIGEGFHPKAGEPHAEMFALRAAGDAAKEADLYVTLEPCSHHGRTPPCTDAIIQAGIRRVYAAMVDPNPRVAGKGIEKLRDAGIEVHIGFMESEARELNRGFIKRVTTGLPFVLWKAAMSLDGKIAAKTGDSKWITGEDARREVHKLRASHDVIITGIGTVLADDPEMTVRGIKDGINHVRIVVDSRASTPPDAKILNKSSQTIIAVTKQAPEDKLEVLRNAGARLLVLPDMEGLVDLKSLMLEVAGMGYNTAMLECGGELAASMIDAGLVDRGIVFIAPKIIGGKDAKTIVEGKGIERMSEAITASTPVVKRFGIDLALEFDMAKQSDT